MASVVKRASLLQRVFPYSRAFSVNSQLRRKLEHDSAPEKTTISLGSSDRGATIYQPTGLYAGGFQFGEHRVNGPIALLQSTVLKWNVDSLEEIDEQSLSIFGIIYPPIELLIIGTGTKFARINPEITRTMQKRGISLEIQNTRNACGTYNLLQQERPGTVGAALLPLTDITRKLPDIVKRKRLPPDEL